jgi:hypothetical protein
LKNIILLGSHKGQYIPHHQRSRAVQCNVKAPEQAVFESFGIYKLSLQTTRLPLRRDRRFATVIYFKIQEEGLVFGEVAVKE